MHSLCVIGYRHEPRQLLLQSSWQGLPLIAADLDFFNKTSCFATFVQKMDVYDLAAQIPTQAGNMFYANDAHPMADLYHGEGR